MITAAGDRRHRFGIHAPAPGVQDDTGAVAGGQTLVAQAWGSLSPVGARQIEVARSYGETVSHVAAVPWIAGVTAGMFLTLGSRRFVINGVLDPDETRRELKLFLTEVIL